MKKSLQEAGSENGGSALDTKQESINQLKEISTTILRGRDVEEEDIPLINNKIVSYLQSISDTKDGAEASDLLSTMYEKLGVYLKQLNPKYKKEWIEEILNSDSVEKLLELILDLSEEVENQINLDNDKVMQDTIGSFGQSLTKGAAGSFGQSLTKGAAMLEIAAKQKSLMCQIDETMKALPEGGARDVRLSDRTQAELVNKLGLYAQQAQSLRHQLAGLMKADPEDGVRDVSPSGK